jgi:hypothetical protein
MNLLEKFEKLYHDLQNLCTVDFGVFGDVIFEGDGISCCDVVYGFFSFVALDLSEVNHGRNAIFTIFLDTFIYFTYHIYLPVHVFKLGWEFDDQIFASLTRAGKVSYLIYLTLLSCTELFSDKVSSIV